MINPVQAIPPTLPSIPVAAATDTGPDLGPPTPAPADGASRKTASAPDPLELSIARGRNGVFVYSLKDPSTGRLVAVIPAEPSGSNSTDGDYQAGEYVSVSA